MSADDANEEISKQSAVDDELDDLAKSTTQAASGSSGASSSSALTSGQKEQDDLQLLLGLGGVFSTIAEANPNRVQAAQTSLPAENPVKTEGEAVESQMTSAVEEKTSASAAESKAILRNSRLFSQPSSQAPMQSAASMWGFDEDDAVQPPAQPVSSAAEAKAKAEAAPPVIPVEQPPAVSSQPQAEVLAELQMEAASAWFEPSPAPSVAEPINTMAEAVESNAAESIDADAIAETAEAIRQSMASVKRVVPDGKQPQADEPAADSATIVPPALPAAGVNTAMEGLVTKLNEQVKKATAKLISQIEQSQIGLEAEIKTITSKSHKAEQKDEGAFQTALSKMFKTLEDESEEARVNISDAAANGRYAIKQLLEGNQSSIAQQEAQALESLLRSCAALVSGAEALLSSTAHDVDAFTRERKAELNGLIESLLSRISQSRQEHLSSLQDRFERFQNRVAAETDLKGSAMQQMVESLSEDLGLAGERAADKLKLAHQDLENDLKQAVRIFQLEISLLVKSLSNMQLAPTIHQHNTTLQETRQQLQSRFSDDCSQRTAKQEAEFESVYAFAKLKQKEQETDSLQSLEEQNKERQVKITEVFNACKTYIVESETQCKEAIQTIEEDIESSATRSRKLIESSATSPNSDLISLRDTIVKSISGLQKQAAQELLSSMEAHCVNLEDTSKSEQAKLVSLREKNAQDLRDLAQQALEKIESEVHEAFASIQASQQKHLE